MGKTKRFTLPLLFALICMGFNSCTQYKINIGDWHGSWHLQEILIEGEKDESYKQDIMVSFQRNIFNMAYIERAEIYGTWSVAGEILTLNAGYNAGSGTNVSYLFDPFPLEMYFPKGVYELEITVVYINGSTMQWQYTDEATGKLITYNFKKYP